MILWWYIKNDGSRKLVEIDGDLKSAKYNRLLHDNLISDENFRHDGAPCHISHATLHDLVHEGVIILKVWPFGQLRALTKISSKYGQN